MSFLSRGRKRTGLLESLFLGNVGGDRGTVRGLSVSQGPSSGMSVIEPTLLLSYTTPPLPSLPSQLAFPMASHVNFPWEGQGLFCSMKGHREVVGANGAHALETHSLYSCIEAEETEEETEEAPLWYTSTVLVMAYYINNQGA